MIELIPEYIVCTNDAEWSGAMLEALHNKSTCTNWGTIPYAKRAEVIRREACAAHALSAGLEGGGWWGNLSELLYKARAQHITTEYNQTHAVFRFQLLASLGMTCRVRAGLCLYLPPEHCLSYCKRGSGEFTGQDDYYHLADPWGLVNDDAAWNSILITATAATIATHEGWQRVEATPLMRVEWYEEVEA